MSSCCSKTYSLSWRIAPPILEFLAPRAFTRCPVSRPLPTGPNRYSPKTRRTYTSQPTISSQYGKSTSSKQNVSALFPKRDESQLKFLHNHIYESRAWPMSQWRDRLLPEVSRDLNSLDWATRLWDALKSDSIIAKSLDPQKDRFVANAMSVCEYLKLHLLFVPDVINQFQYACLDLQPHTLPFLAAMSSRNVEQAHSAVIQALTPNLSLNESDETLLQKCALDFLCTYFLSTTAGDTEVVFATFQVLRSAFDATGLAYSKNKGFRLRLLQKAVWLVLKYGPRNNLRQVLDFLKTMDFSYSPNTLLRLSQAMAHVGDVDMAIDFLRRAKADGYRVESLIFSQVCCTILRSSAMNEDGYKANLKLVEDLIEMGTPLNIHHYNTLMVNAIEARDLETARNIYSLMRENGFCPNAATYSILCKAYSQAPDPEGFAQLKSEIQKSTDLVLDATLALDMLHAIWLNGKSIRETFAFYAQHFDIQPLQDLGIINGPDFACGYNTFSKSSHQFAALGLVLQAWLSTQPNQKLNVEVKACYEAFRKLVRSGDPYVAPLAEQDHAYNSFLLRYARSKDQIKACLQIVQDMNTSETVTIDSPGAEKRTFQTAKPTVQTFSILMSAFVHNRQLLAAEKVLEIMDQRQLKPNHVTWTVLIKGYATAQDIDGTVNTLVRMGRGGFDINGRVMEALALIQDRKTFRERLQAQHVSVDGDPGSKTSSGAAASNETQEDWNLEDMATQVPVDGYIYDLKPEL